MNYNPSSRSACATTEVEAARGRRMRKFGLIPGKYAGIQSPVPIIIGMLWYLIRIINGLIRGILIFKIFTGDRNSFS